MAYCASPFCHRRLLGALSKRADQGAIWPEVAAFAAAEEGRARSGSGHPRSPEEIEKICRIADMDGLFAELDDLPELAAEWIEGVAGERIFVQCKHGKCWLPRRTRATAAAKPRDGRRRGHA